MKHISIYNWLYIQLYNQLYIHKETCKNENNLPRYTDIYVHIHIFGNYNNRNKDD